MRRVLKKITLTLVALLTVGIIALAVTGLPAPPALTVENVPRVPWKWAWRLASTVQSLNTTTSFTAWMPEDYQMLVGTGGGNVRHLTGPGASLGTVEGLPERATNIRLPKDSTNKIFIFSVDEGGSELYNHYLYDRTTQTATPWTHQGARSYLCCFNPEGNLVAYSSARRNGEDADLYLINPLDPASDEMVYQAEGVYVPRAWSQDGRYIAVIEHLSHTFERIHVFDVEKRSMRQLLPAWGDSVSYAQSTLTWSADSKSLFFASDYDAEVEQLYRFDMESESATAILESSWDITDLEITPDGTRLAFLMNEDGLSSLHVLDLQDGSVERISNVHQGVLGKGLYMHPWRSEFAVAVTSASNLTSVYSYDLENGSWTRWTHLGPDETDLPLVELQHYPTFDSVDGSQRMIPAFVFRASPIFEDPRPVLILIHGGPASQSGPLLRLGYDMMRRHGITVITPNVRGSSGYGKTYLKLDDHHRREDAVRDIGALLDWIATQETLDQNRIAVMGGSYGGYMVLASLTHYSDRLQCGIDLYGISNFVTFLEASQEHHFADAQRAEYGDERDPEVRAFLESISPANHADQITVPLMIFQGANDIRVKPEESRQMVERIREHGGTVHYIEAANEGHGLTKPLNLLYVGAAGMPLLEECLLQ